jgi:hypothetical protein
VLYNPWCVRNRPFLKKTILVPIFTTFSLPVMICVQSGRLPSHDPDQARATRSLQKTAFKYCDLIHLVPAIFGACCCRQLRRKRARFLLAQMLVASGLKINVTRLSKYLIGDSVSSLGKARDLLVQKRVRWSRRSF